MYKRQNLACAGGRVDDEAHEAERRRAQLVAEEQPCRLLGGDVTLAGTLEEDAPQDCLRLVGVVVRAADGPGEDVGGGGRPLLSFAHILDHVPHRLVPVQYDLEVDVRPLMRESKAAVAVEVAVVALGLNCCLLYTSPSPRDQRGSRMPSSA